MEGSGGATYVLLIQLSLPLNFVLVKANFKSLSEVSKFGVNSLSIVYHCAIHNLPAFGEIVVTILKKHSI